MKKIDVPTLFLLRDNDQIVPVADSARVAPKIIKNAKLVVYKGAPHCLRTILRTR